MYILVIVHAFYHNNIFINLARITKYVSPYDTVFEATESNEIINIIEIVHVQYIFFILK